MPKKKNKDDFPRGEDSKKFELGQYFTKKSVVEEIVDLVSEYLDYDKDIDILEPSFGTGNFIEVLKDRGFKNIDGCEIDKSLFNESLDLGYYEKDFFELPMEKKYDLIIGNPPFSKYNLEKSYYKPQDYISSSINPSIYLNQEVLGKDKIKIENAFILKSIKHLKDKDSSIGFVLPISFFIKDKNKKVKNKIKNNFSTIIIYQNSSSWFDYDIPCCFVILSNLSCFKEEIVLLFEDDEKKREVINLERMHEEIIPKTHIFKKEFNEEGTKLKEYLKEESINYEKSYEDNTISASNILEYDSIPSNEKVEDYKLAVCRVGNASVGRAGLVNIEEEILNDMFYVFSFKKKYANNKKLKERVCEQINKNQDYFKNVTIRVGSKSIKKKDIFDFKIVE
ncbi:hypothetical protein C9439_01840 [archaeon SCG-AAA382B04]|nr:hypothetical protein C9439_01840 [archaeon SCG-AAA382B04]